jgi:hypothetical protein
MSKALITAAGIGGDVGSFAAELPDKVSAFKELGAAIGDIAERTAPTMTTQGANESFPEIQSAFMHAKDVRENVIDFRNNRPQSDERRKKPAKNAFDLIYKISEAIGPNQLAVTKWKLTPTLIRMVKGMKKPDEKVFKAANLERDKQRNKDEGSVLTDPVQRKQLLKELADLDEEERMDAAKDAEHNLKVRRRTEGMQLRRKGTSALGDEAANDIVLQKAAMWEKLIKDEIIDPNAPFDPNNMIIKLTEVSEDRAVAAVPSGSGTMLRL